VRADDEVSRETSAGAETSEAVLDADVPVEVRDRDLGVGQASGSAVEMAVAEAALLETAGDDPTRAAAEAPRVAVDTAVAAPGLASEVEALGPDVPRETRPPDASPVASAGLGSTETPLGTGAATVIGTTRDVPRETEPGDTATLTTQASPTSLERDLAALADELPPADVDTPLAQQVAVDARRRITLSSKVFPKPDQIRVLTVANQKGGVGKTTTTVNVAAALAQAGLRVLVIDIDPQGNASTALGIDHHAEVASIYDVLVEGMDLAEVVQECPDIPNLWCAPATIDLAGAEIELVSLVARETRMQRALRRYIDSAAARGEERLDYVLIDCPPSLGLLTVNAFVAAEEVFIPIQCEYYALEGLSQLLKNIELIKTHLNPDLHVSTILLTMYDGRTRLSAQVADDVRSHFPEQVLRTTVPRSVRISEAPSHGQTVMTYDPSSSGALSYLEAAGELADRGSSAE